MFFPMGLCRAAAGVKFLVGATCLELGRGRVIPLCLLRDESVLLTAFRSTASAKACALAAAPHLSGIRCLFHGISVKEQRVFSSIGFVTCCDKHFLVFVCHSALMARPGLVSPLCVSLLPLEGGGQGSHSSHGQ